MTNIWQCINGHFPHLVLLVFPKVGCPRIPFVRKFASWMKSNTWKRFCVHLQIKTLRICGHLLFKKDRGMTSMKHGPPENVDVCQFYKSQNSSLEWSILQSKAMVLRYWSIRGCESTFFLNLEFLDFSSRAQFVTKFDGSIARIYLQQFQDKPCRFFKILA